MLHAPWETGAAPRSKATPHILAFEGDSRVYGFEGNYARYEEDRRRRLGHDADRPHRITYRRLQRG